MADTSLFTSLQGAAVALLLCFLNGEVQGHLKAVYRRLHYKLRGDERRRQSGTRQSLSLTSNAAQPRALFRPSLASVDSTTSLILATLRLSPSRASLGSRLSQDEVRADNSRSREESPSNREERISDREESPSNREESPSIREESPSNREESPRSENESSINKKESPGNTEKNPSNREESPTQAKQVGEAKRSAIAEQRNDLPRGSRDHQRYCYHNSAFEYLDGNSDAMQSEKERGHGADLCSLDSRGRTNPDPASCSFAPLNTSQGRSGPTKDRELIELREKQRPPLLPLSTTDTTLVCCMSQQGRHSGESFLPDSESLRTDAVDDVEESPASGSESNELHRSCQGVNENKTQHLFEGLGSVTALKLRHSLRSERQGSGMRCSEERQAEEKQCEDKESDHIDRSNPLIIITHAD